MGWVLAFIVLILGLVAISNFHVFTAYTFNIDEAYEQFNKWKKNYERTMDREIEIIDIKHCSTYVDFYYKTKKKKK